MNKSEIAESRREKFSAWYKANYLKIAGVSSWVERAWSAYEAGADWERAIAESRQKRKSTNVEPNNDNRRDRNLRSGDTSSDSELRNASSVELGDGGPSPE